MQKSILKRALSLLVCLAVLIAGMPLAIFNVGAEASLSVITDNFDGENNWSSLTSDASPIKDGTFLPANTQLFQSGITNIYTYDNWSDREIKTVEAKYMNAPAYGYGSLLVYDYQDDNNYRGLFIQTSSAGSVYTNFFRVIKQSDPETNNVYFYKDATRYHYLHTSVLDVSQLGNIKFEYKSDNKITFTLSNSDASKSGSFDVLTGDFTTDAAQVSTDGGTTFEALGSSYTFTGIENVKNCEFAIGSSSAATYIDDLVITFEKTDAEIAEEFKTTHAAILAKTVGTVTADDKAAIAAASADYDALSDGAKALLEDEYKLLGQLEDAIIAGSFNVSSFTDDFSGDNYWAQVGFATSTDSPITASGTFSPKASTDITNGLASVYAHKYWPNREIKSVSGVLNTVYFTPATIYYYKDANNWRGFFYQMGSSAHGRYIMKESDPSDPNKVYYYYSTSNNKPSFIAKPSDSKVNFNITYDSNSSITYTATIYKGTENETSKSVTFGSSLAVAAANLKVSTDGGKTFATATEGYTFKAITDAKSSQFAMGYTETAGGSFDDITVSFEEAPQDLADKFLEKYAELLAKDEASVTMADKETIYAAIAEYGTLTSDAQELLADEYELLSKMSEAIFSGTMDGESYTETFEDDYLWKCDGTPANKVITELADGNKVFTPGGVGSIGAPVVYTHRYWQDKVLTSVTGKMYISDRSLSSTYPSNVIVYNYKDADNWRGVYFTNILTDTGELFSQPVKFIGKENGVNKTYYYYSLGNKEFSIENRVTTFTITYNENGTASLVLTNDTGTSSTIDLINDCVGGYVERVNNNYGAFGVASVTGASADDWFDDITFNFGDTFEQKAEAFKDAYADTLALDLETVTNDNKLEIAALYDAYNKITRNDKMATLLSAEGEKVDALIEAVKAYNKNTTDAIRIAFVGDSNTESGNMNGGPLAEVGYPYMVQQELNRMYGEGKFVVGNFGISGKTAREYYQFVYDGNGNYLKRGMLESLFFDPDIVVLCLGGNDALYSTDEAFEYYYKKLADEYVALVGEENFIATAPIHHYHSIENNCPKRREAIKTMADANGWSFFNLYADTYDFLINNRDVYDSVGLHPVQAYDVLANAAVNYLDKNILGQYDLDKIVSEEFEAFEETYTMSGTEVSADNLDAINEALAKYETLTDAQKATYAEEKAALESIKAIATFDKEVKNTVVTPANVDVVAEKQAAYEALGVDNAAIEESIANLQKTVDSFSSQVLGCSIKTDADPTKQDLRYEYAKPEWVAPEGWSVKEYGAIFYPAAALGNNPLTLETPKIAKGAGELNPDGSVPSTFRANLVGSALKSINCSMDIAGTAYVIWTDGTNEYVCYSNNTVDNSGYTENNVVNGVGVRSVYKTARKIAAAIYGTTEYGEVVYTEAVKVGGNLADFKDADILEFVSKNIDAITNYVGKNQGE
ncbi:MAG: SGNH/GDSL hydrolase family protein [Clostridia bacterium]|nr:SGNH/GDSL hydrolase family protein [Clostridia bacterium]